MQEALMDFINYYDFDSLLETFSSGSYMEVVNSTIVWVVVGTILAMIAYPRSRDLGTMLFTYGSVGAVYFVGGVVLKNSDISTPGPFVLLILLAGGAAGYFLWTRMIMTS